MRVAITCIVVLFALATCTRASSVVASETEALAIDAAIDAALAAEEAENLNTEKVRIPCRD